MKNTPKPKGTKQWLRALNTNKGNEQLRIQNQCVETDYQRVIASVKKLYLQSNMEVVVFDRDYKFDTTEGLFGMHSFITPHFYWRLDCEATNDFKIEYDFYKFPFENEIKSLLRAFPLDRTAHHKPRQPNCTEFHKRVIAAQERRYQYLLKVY